MVVIIFVLIGVSEVLGNIAALQMTTQSMVKNSMLCQILFLSGVIAGCSVVVLFQTWERAGDEGAREER
jgi:hypothetical protein